MTGVASRIQTGGKVGDLGLLKKAFDSLMGDQQYLVATETGTSQEANVATRLSKARKAFSEIP